MFITDSYAFIRLVGVLNYFVEWQIDPDQTTPQEQPGSRYALLAYTILSDTLRHLPYIKSKSCIDPEKELFQPKITVIFLISA